MKLDYTFTRSDIAEAEELFKRAIEKYFGEVWKLTINARYKGVDVSVRDPKDFRAALWHLCQGAKARGATRAAGRIEVKDVGTELRFILFYDTASLVAHGMEILQ
jgi:hypothetical protein